MIRGWIVFSPGSQIKPFDICSYFQIHATADVLEAIATAAIFIYVNFYYRYLKNIFIKLSNPGKIFEAVVKYRERIFLGRNHAVLPITPDKLNTVFFRHIHRLTKNTRLIISDHSSVSFKRIF